METKEPVKRVSVTRPEEKNYHEEIKRKCQNIKPPTPQIEDNTNTINNNTGMPRRDADPLSASPAQFSPRNNQQVNFLPKNSHDNKQSTDANSYELDSLPPGKAEKQLLLSGDNQQPVSTNSVVYSGPFAKQPSQLPKQPTISASPRVLTNEPKLEYIKIFFKPLAKGNTNKEYEDYLKAYNNEFEFQLKSGKKEKPRTAPFNILQNGILMLFEKGSDSYFEEGRASKYCRCVRTIIMDFEQECMEYNKPSLGDERWENCHEELFFLKYFCKKAAEVKNDMFLVLVVNGIIINNVSKTLLPSCYDKFRNNLEELTKRQNGDCLPSFSIASDGNLIVQENAERNHVVDNDSTQELERLTDENLKLKIHCAQLEKEVGGFDKKFEDCKAELRAEFSQRQQCTLL